MNKSEKNQALKRVQRYEQFARQRIEELGLTEKPRAQGEWRTSPPQKRTLTKEQEKQDRENVTAKALFKMLSYSKQCCNAINAGNLDAFLQAFEWLTDARIEAGVSPFIDSYEKAKSRKGGEGKSGHKSPFTKKIEDVCKAFDARPPLNDVLKKLESMAKDYDPVIQEVIWETKKVVYLDNGNSREVNFSTINNKLSDIYKKR